MDSMPQTPKRRRLSQSALNDSGEINHTPLPDGWAVAEVEVEYLRSESDSKNEQDHVDLETTGKLLDHESKVIYKITSDDSDFVFREIRTTNESEKQIAAVVKSIKPKWIEIGMKNGWFSLSSNHLEENCLMNAEVTSQGWTLEARKHWIRQWILGSDQSEKGEEILPSKIVRRVLDAVQPLEDDSCYDMDECRGMISTLRPFQRKTVAWMLQREGSRLCPKSPSRTFQEWVEIKSGSIPIFANPLMCTAQIEQPTDDQQLKGGILCDEMGLGKTVEVFACILSNMDQKVGQESLPNVTNMIVTSSTGEGLSTDIRCSCGADDMDRDSDIQCCESCKILFHKKCMVMEGMLVKDRFYCKACDPLVIVDATLIITPESIAPQWRAEISKHIKLGQVQYTFYDGLKGSKTKLSIDDITRQDIVLTTYEVMKSDLSYLEPTRKSPRSAKKYFDGLSILPFIRWKRVVFDESQLVEGNCKASLMARQLKSDIWWCVTGTPIRNNLSDLYGLISILDPLRFTSNSEWKKLIQDPLEKDEACASVILNYFRSFIWRTNKESVMNQLGLPATNQDIHWVKFSAPEMFQYRKLLSICSKEAVELTLRHEASQIIDKSTAPSFFIPYLNLRKSCGLQPIPTKEIVQGTQTSSSVVDLLGKLIQKSRIECQDEMRKLVMNLNGLAAIQVIQKEYKEALETYHRTLALYQEMQLPFEMDDIQKHHILHNITDVVSSFPHDGYEVNMKEIPREMERIKKAFVSDANNVWLQSKQACDQDVEKCKKLLKSPITWWKDAINHLQHNDQSESFMQNLTMELHSSSSPAWHSASTFLNAKDITSLGFRIKYVLDSILQSRKETLASIDKICGIAPTPKMIESMENCGRCKGKRTEDVCDHCQILEQLSHYERYVRPAVADEIAFESSVEDPAPSKTEIRRQRLESSHLFIALRKLSGIRGRAESNEEDEMDVFEQLRKEMKSMRSLCVSHKNMVGALGELEMCKIRVRLRHPGEVVSKDQRHFILETYQVDQQKHGYLSGKADAETKVRSIHGQMNYLEAMERGRKENIVPFSKSDCPICHELIEDEAIVLICGHAVCSVCSQALVERSHFGNIRCPTCRRHMSTRDVTCASIRADTDMGSEIDTAVGSFKHYGAKATALLKILMEAIRQDEKTKAIIFSQWNETLDVVNNLLKDASISTLFLQEKKTRQEKIKEFRFNSEIHVLLINSNFGSSGLNLTEATHVMILEPLPTVADEMQAIGRVSRMGQTKSTYVHRFLIKDTVEEHIHQLRSTRGQSSLGRIKKQGLTVSDIRTLFLGELRPSLAVDE